MAITYPLTLPETPATREIEILPVALVGESEGEFDGAQQIQDWVAGWLEMVLEYPAPLDLDEAEPLVALGLALNGKAGTLAAGDTTRKLARGAAANYQTNLLLWSEEFQRVEWTKQSAVITPHALDDGGVLMAKLERSGASSNPQVSQKKNVAAGEVVTVSVEAKEGTAGIDVDFAMIWRDAANGTISTVSSSIQDVTGTRTRFSHTFAAAPTNTATGELFIRARNTASDGQFVYIARAQYEKASAFSGYLPTGGAVVYSDIARDFLLFDGVDDYVSIPHNGAYNTNSQTLEGVFRAPKVAPAANKSILQKGFFGGNALAFAVQLRTDGKVTVQASDSGSTVTEAITSTDVFLDGKLHHFMWVKEFLGAGSEKHTLYIDGKLQATATRAYNALQGTGVVYVGNGTNGASSAAYSDAICEIRIWNTARTQTQDRDNLAKQLVGNESGLVGYWRADEATGATLDDLTTTNNNGTISGAVWSGLNRYEMLTANWPASQTGVLKRGDWLQLGTVAAATAALKKTMGASDVDSNAGGVALVDIFPLLRGTLPADQAAIVHYDAKGLWRQQENATPYRIDVVKHYGITLRLKEAF